MSLFPYLKKNINRMDIRGPAPDDVRMDFAASKRREQRELSEMEEQERIQRLNDEMVFLQLHLNCVE